MLRGPGTPNGGGSGGKWGLAGERGEHALHIVPIEVVASFARTSPAGSRPETRRESEEGSGRKGNAWQSR
jgi:hypothetical protein